MLIKFIYVVYYFIIMRKIILDTDFLLHNLNQGIDFLSEMERVCDFNYVVCILDKTLDEIKGKKGEKLALDFIKKKLKIIKTGLNKSVDDILLGMENVVIATHDKVLKEKLKKRGIPLIVQQGSKCLKLENVL